MNITHVCKVWYPRATGVTVHVDCLARWMKAAGHQVSVVTYDFSGELLPDMKWREEEHNGYRTFKTRFGNREIVQKAIEATQPDVVHAHGIWEHVHPAWEAARTAGARFALTAHGTWQFLYRTPGMESWHRRFQFWWYYRTRWRAMARDAEAVIALNAIEEKAYHALGVKNVYRIPNGVDCREFYPEVHTPLPATLTIPENYIFYAGAVQTQKGIFTLLDALCRLKGKGLCPHVLVAGDGPELERSQSLARDRQLNISFAGRVDRQYMPRLMADAGLFVLPSESEPFATVYLEAMASGTPCIGTASGGTPEIIVDGENGFLIPIGDVGMLAKVIENYYTPETDKTIYDKIKMNAVQRVQSNFDWSILTPRILQAYLS